jgi:hypothetical protein
MSIGLAAAAGPAAAAGLAAFGGPERTALDEARTSRAADKNRNDGRRFMMLLPGTFGQYAGAAAIATGKIAPPQGQAWKA